MAHRNGNGNGTRRRRCPECGELFTARGLKQHLTKVHPDYDQDEDVEVEAELRIAILLDDETVFSLPTTAEHAMRMAKDLTGAALAERIGV